MAKFVVKASEFKNVLKAVNDRKLAELKKEIIEILKKQDSKEVRKAVEYFESQEKHYSHLEKSLSGKWVEKAGYGVGTVRIWKGKKYKKIAPGKWARMYEKEGRGTNIAIGKLIARVQNIDNVEDLMAFVQANKQRFVDENGMDLPVLDKLRAAVDARNDNVGSKGTSKPAEKKDTFEDEMNRLNDAQEVAWEGFESGSEIKATPENSKKFYDKVKKFVDENNIKLTKKHHDELEEINSHSFNEALALAGAYGEEEKKKALEWNKEANKKYKGAALDLSQIDEFKETEKKTDNPYEVTEEFKRQAMKDPKTELLQMADAVRNAEVGSKEYDSALNDFQDAREKFIEEQGMEEYKKIMPEYPKGKESKEAEAEKHQNRSDAMKGNKNAYKGGLAKETVKFVKEVKGEPFEEYNTEKDKFALYYDRDSGKETGLVISQEIADIIDSHNEPSILDWKDNIAAEIHEKYPNIDESYIKQGLGGIRPGFASGKKKSVKVVSSDESKIVEEPAKETEPKDEPKKTRETKSQFKRELPAGSAKTVKENIGTFTKAGDGKVEMPATKEVAELFDSLNKAASKEENRHFMTDAYYDGENFVSTDGRRLVCIKAGDIGLDKGYVKVDTNGGKITVTALPEKKDYEFPNYKRVMPGSANTQEVKFDNKALKEKLKEMKKDGAFNKKTSNGVAIEFKDGKAYLDGTVVGSGDVKFPEGQEPFIKLNGFYLMDAALAGDSSSMFLDKDNPAHRATDISTNNSDIVIMTMEPVRSDYESGRKAKADKKAAKDKAKAENRKNNEKLLANFEPTKVDRNVENVASDIDSKLSEFSDDDLKENYDRLTIDFDKVMEKPGLMSLYSKVNKNGLSFGNAYLYSQLAKKHPEIKEKFEAEMKKRGLEVKKSLFDGFLVAELLEEDVDEEEEDEEEESLWNDYSAEQPELFNSVEFKVREALNRRYCNCL